MPGLSSSSPKLTSPWGQPPYFFRAHRSKDHRRVLRSIGLHNPASGFDKHAKGIKFKVVRHFMIMGLGIMSCLRLGLWSCGLEHSYGITGKGPLR